MADKFVLILVCGLTMIGTLLLTASFIAPGWYIIDRNGLKRWSGIWFTTMCTNSSCETITYKEQVEREPFREIQYAYRIETQVITTLALVAAITGCALTILGSCDLKFSLIFQAKTARCFIATAAFVLREAGFFAAEINLQNHTYPEYIQGFPYALLLSTVGSFLLLIVGVRNFVSSQRKVQNSLVSQQQPQNSYGRQDTHQPVQRDSVQESYSNLTLIVLLVISVIGFMLQLAGFASPGWVVTVSRQQQMYSGYTYTTKATGIWYHISCSTISPQCSTQSLFDYYKAEIERDKFYKIEYGIVVGNQVCATLSQFVAGLAVLFGLLSLLKKERSILLLNITEICCLISALLIWPVIGETLGKTSVWIRKQDEWTTYQFPYSLFLSALGSLLLLIVYLVHTFKFFWWLYQKRNNKRNAEEINPTTLEFTKM